MTYSEAIQYLYGLRLFGAKLGLENTLKLAGMAGHPETDCGLSTWPARMAKGQRARCWKAFIARRVCGGTFYFAAPGVVPRTDANRAGMDFGKEVVRLVEKFRELAGQFPKEHHPTFFEMVTVMALEFFADHGCEVVIWETGLGGRLDATNIVTPLASVITNIAFDHQQWLGDTLAKIAFEKAGIIKPGVPVVTATEEPEALAVIRSVAAEKNAPLTVVDEGLAGIRGAAAFDGRAPETQRGAGAGDGGDFAEGTSSFGTANARGFEEVNWPGRLQLIEKAEGRKILLDGAHNIAGAKALREAVEKNFPRGQTNIHFGDF